MGMVLGGRQAHREAGIVLVMIMASHDSSSSAPPVPIGMLVHLAGAPVESPTQIFGSWNGLLHACHESLLF